MENLVYVYNDNLESKRLITRFLTINDVNSWKLFFEDKEAIELFPPFDTDSNELRSRQWIDRIINRYENKKFGLQALIEKDTNRFIGQCGLLTQEVDGLVEIEVGYHIFKKYWGQGFATEAARLFIDYAFENNLTKSVISIIDRRNIKSQRVAEKNGLRFEKETKWKNLSVYIYRINS